MYTPKELEELFDTEDLLDKMVYKDTGFQQVAELVVSNAKEVKFKEINHLVVSYNMDQLRAAKTADVLDNTLRRIFSAFCTDNKELATSFVWRLKNIRRTTNEAHLTWLKEKKTPDIALKDMKYVATRNLFEWLQVYQWTKYVDAYNVVYYDKRLNVVAATKLSDKELFDMVATTGFSNRSSSRLWVVHGLIDYWHELKYSPVQLYRHLGWKKDAKPDFDSNSFAVWMKYVGKGIVSELELILSRKQLVDMLIGRETGNSAIIKADLLLHLVTERQNLVETAAGSAAIKEVENFIYDLQRKNRPRESESSMRRSVRQK